MTFVAIFCDVIFFPTTTIIQRSVVQQMGEMVAPISDALAARMASLIDSELVMVVTMPVTASLLG